MLLPPSHLLSLPLLNVGSLTLLVLPLLVELAVLVRGMYTREPTDIVLATFAVPCLFVSMWAAVEGLNSSGGVYWGGFFGLFSVAVAGLLAFLVVMDSVVGAVVRARATE